MKTNKELNTNGAEFNERVRSNQASLAAKRKPQYDFIVCGPGSSDQS